LQICTPAILIAIYTTVAYFTGNKSIATVDSAKDLGITITQNLTWESHHKLISERPIQSSWINCRSFSDSGPVMTRKLYISH